MKHADTLANIFRRYIAKNKRSKTFNQLYFWESEVKGLYYRSYTLKDALNAHKSGAVVYRIALDNIKAICNAKRNALNSTSDAFDYPALRYFGIRKSAESLAVNLLDDFFEAKSANIPEIRVNWK